MGSHSSRIVQFILVRSVRLCVVSPALSIVCSASPGTVDGIPVRGDVASVSGRDVGDAIAAVPDGLGEVSKVTVLNADRIRVFFKNADLGWMAVHRNLNAKDPTQP